MTHPMRWQSYDSVAETYERVAVPWFEPMAFDLVTALAPGPGTRILGVGSGTALVTAFAESALGARRRRRRRLVDRHAAGGL